jgi:hypothetical protein
MDPADLAIQLRLRWARMKEDWLTRQTVAAHYNDMDEVVRLAVDTLSKRKDETSD